MKETLLLLLVDAVFIIAIAVAAAMMIVPIGYLFALGWNLAQ